MQNSNQDLVVSRPPTAWGSLLVLTGFVLIGMAVGNILAVAVLALLFSSHQESVTVILNHLITNPAQVPNGWNALMILQGTVHFFSYLLPSLLFWLYIERKPVSDISPTKNPPAIIWALAFMLVLVFIPVNSLFIDLNASMKLPDALSGLERWMRHKEDQLSVMTEFITNYKSFSQLLIALFVVTLLPALGEEALFRGVLQTKIQRLTGNGHLAIWVSAAIFSAIHFQFYGFLPRMLLGALFGYLFYWTGNFWVAVLAHFVNNGFVLVMMYLRNLGIIKIDIEETKSMPILLIALSFFMSMAILRFIRQVNASGQGTVQR
ncbi:CPBP family intramembrane glutamic endopeptidase [Dyadobacter sp. CY343]|uniref:CPBP family intramembrane glutamic endopeptidase n=1 Tax=Dyadobacter sp. CY343 TaxID=2907299 RepID=UPI001F462FEA|nr:CPBP family intramembrane glutamic endopeptidase [Dyadobacter sp. CY343]MCE7061459.1 CPBP family intramembrane metalloprotease [Dyadobacter sp. CY343]